MCPFIDREDPRCTARHDLIHLEDAIHLCGFAYESCPTFCELYYAEPENRSASVPAPADQEAVLVA